MVLYWWLGVVLSVFGLFVLLGEAAGLIVSVFIFFKLFRVAKLIGSIGIELSALSFLIFGIALGLELGGNLYTFLGFASKGGLGRPIEVSFLLANRGVLLAGPVYISSYTLYVASLVVGHVSIEENKDSSLFALTSVPFILQLYADNNLVSLAILLVAWYLVLSRLGASIEWLVFYSMLTIGHILLIIAGFTGYDNFLLAGLAVRAFAPAVFLAVERLTAGTTGKAS